MLDRNPPDFGQRRFARWRPELLPCVSVVVVLLATLAGRLVAPMELTAVRLPRTPAAAGAVEAALPALHAMAVGVGSRPRLNLFGI